MSVEIVGSVQKQYLDRDLASINSLVVLFRHIDNDFEKSLSCEEFNTAMSRYGTGFEEQLLRDLFKLLNKDCSGHVALREFMHQLQLPMSVSVINEAFDKMNVVYKDDLQIWDNHAIVPVMWHYHKEHVAIALFLNITKHDKILS